MATFNFPTTKAANTNLELGALDFALFLAVGKTVALPTSFAVQNTTGGGVIGDLAPLPAGLLPVGQLDKKAAVALESTITTTPTESYGLQSPTRMIRKSREVTLDVTLQETKMLTLGAYWGVDFSSVQASATTGEVNLPVPESPLNVEYRAVAIGKDGAAGAEIYTIFDMPRLTLQKTGKIQYNDDGIATYPATFMALYDSAYGYAIRPSYCGLGWMNLTHQAGFGPSVNEVQTIAISGTPTGGTFTLTALAQTTTAIAYNATPAAVQSALAALSSIGTGNVAVTGTAGSSYVVTFQGALAAQPIALMTATASLTGGTSPAVTVTETTLGHS